MAIRVLMLALLTGCLTAAAAAAPNAQPLDVELAIATTGSIGPSIERIQRHAAKLVTEARARFPGVQFAVGQFKDSGATPEYEVLQAMTGEPKLVADAVTCDKIAVLSRSRVLTQSGWAPFGPANGKAYYFDFPSSASMSGTYAFCVRSRDPSGNVSRPSCAPLIIT